MDISIWTFIIVCPLVFIGGFVDSIAGGGGLITLPAYLVTGLPAHYSMGTNKFASFFGTLTASINYIKAGFIDWYIAIFGAISAIIGAFIGTNLALIIDNDLLLIIFVVLIPITAVFVLSNKGLSKKRKPYSRNKTLIICSIISLFLGAYDGFYGPGTGTFIIILFNSVAHLDINKANGNSKIVNLASNVSSTIVFACNGKTIFILGIAAAIFQILGNFIGSKLFINKGLKIIKPIMLTVLIILLAKIILDIFGIY